MFPVRDILLIKENDEPVTRKQLEDAFYNYGYDFALKRGKTPKQERFCFDIYDFDIQVGPYDMKIFSDITDRLAYAYACYFDDTAVTRTIHHIFPDLKDIKVPDRRLIYGNQLKEWLHDYNITLEDFIKNNRYIVLSGNWSSIYSPFNKLKALGLLNKNVEYAE